MPATRSAKGDVAELLGDRVRFADGTVEPVDAIVYATGYKVSFPFFDPELLAAPENVLPLYKRMLKPGLDDLAFIGLGQPIPTIFPFSELQSKLAARWLSGDWAPPAQRRDGSRDRARRGVSHRPLHQQAPAHDAARVVRVRSTSSHALDPRRPGACARWSADRARCRARGRAAQSAARSRSRGSQTAVDASASRSTAAGCAARASIWPARATPSPARTAAAPAWCSATASAAPSTRGFCPSPSASPPPGSTRLRSTTGTSAQATASPASCSRSPASSRTTPRRSPSRARSRASIPIGSWCGAPPTPAATSSRWPSPTATSPRSSRRCPPWTARVALLNLARYAGPSSSLKLMLVGLRDLAASLRGRPPVMLALVGPPGSLGAMTTARRRPRLPRDRGPELAQRGGRANRVASGHLPSRLQADRLPCPILIQIADRDTDRTRQGRPGRRLARDRPGRGAHLSDRALRDLPRRAIRAGDRRPAALPQAASQPGGSGPICSMNAVSAAT